MGGGGHTQDYQRSALLSIHIPLEYESTRYLSKSPNKKCNQIRPYLLDVIVSQISNRVGRQAGRRDANFRHNSSQNLASAFSDNVLTGLCSTPLRIKDL